MTDRTDETRAREAQAAPGDPAVAGSLARLDALLAEGAAPERLRVEIETLADLVLAEAERVVGGSGAGG